VRVTSRSYTIIHVLYSSRQGGSAVYGGEAPAIRVAHRALPRTSRGLPPVPGVG
jgi:hypothetical protein